MAPEPQLVAPDGRPFCLGRFDTINRDGLETS